MRTDYDDDGGEIGSTDFKAWVTPDDDINPRLKAVLKWIDFREFCGLGPHDHLEILRWRASLEWAAQLLKHDDDDLRSR